MVRMKAKKESAPKVFICYAKKDASNANELFEELQTAGANPWLDKRKLELGDDWEYEIKKAVKEADVFVACLSPGFDDVGFRQREVRWALEALELRDFSIILGLGVDVGVFLERHGEQVPALGAVGATLEQVPGLRHLKVAIDRAVDREGNIRESAAPYPATVPDNSFKIRRTSRAGP